MEVQGKMNKKDEAAELAKKIIEHGYKYNIPMQKKKTNKKKSK